MKLFTSTKVFLLLALLAANLIPSQTLFALCGDPNCCKTCGEWGAEEYYNRPGCDSAGGTCHVVECYSSGPGCLDTFNDSCWGFVDCF